MATKVIEWEGTVVSLWEWASSAPEMPVERIELVIPDGDAPWDFAFWLHFRGDDEPRLACFTKEKAWDLATNIDIAGDMDMVIA